MKTRENVSEMRINQEVMARMCSIRMHPKVIQAYSRNELYQYMDGKIMPVDEETKKVIAAFEAPKRYKAFYAIHNTLRGIGHCISILYVSSYVDDWEMEQQALLSGYPLCYVHNADNTDFSEFGTIGIENIQGIIIRTA